MGLDRAVLFRLATSERFEAVVRGAPGGEVVAWRAARRYVAGGDAGAALDVAADLLDRGHGVSVDRFGERVRDPARAKGVLAEYLELAAALPVGDAWLSVDLTHLGLAADSAGATDRLAAIASALPAGRRVQVGAEDAVHADAVLGCVLAVAARGLADRVGATVQANLLRSRADADALAAAGVHVRLVKGAYVERAGALPYGEPTDVAYLELAFGLAAAGASWSLATHDGRLREALLLGLGPLPVEQLLGVRSEALGALADRGIPTRVYVPYGPEWFRYWLRRVAESRGA